MDHQYRRGSSVKADLGQVTSTVLGINWYEKFLAYLKGAIPIDPHGFAFDVLKDLCEDTVPEQVMMHLLALLEENAWIFDREDMLEQTAGTLLNIFSTAKPLVKRRLLFTITNLLLCNYDLVRPGNAIDELFSDFIELLISTGIKISSNVSLATAANECLRVIEDSNPKTLESFYAKGRINSSSLLLMATLYRSGISLSKEDFHIMIDTMSKLPPCGLQQVLNKLLESLRAQNTVNAFTPLTFKQFFHSFALSSEVYQVHFLLLLIKFYDLELFSSSEEQVLLNQVIRLSTHPSLIIAQRLIMLDFVKSFVFYLQRSNLLDPQKFDILPFDGPDTQEKKLSLLTETSLEDAYLLMKVKSLAGLAQGNRRAINSLYRVLQNFLKQRPSMLDAISAIVVSVIFSSPKQHIRHSLSLLSANDELAPKVCHSFLGELYHNVEDIEDEEDLREIYIACEWIISSKNYLVNDDVALGALLDFLYKKCQQVPKLVPYMLSCCAAAIRFQTIGDKNREILRRILSFVTKESHNNVAISSWAQIYSIAINTLSERENLQKVFDADVEDHGEQLSNVSSGPDHSLVKIRRLVEDVPEKFEKCPDCLALNYEISVVSTSHTVDKVYALIISVASPDQQLEQEIHIPVLSVQTPQTVTFRLKIGQTEPFTLYFECQFNNENGSSYFCRDVHEEQIVLQDMLISAQLMRPVAEVWLEIDRVPTSLESVISLRSLKNIDDFKRTFPWTRNYFVDDELPTMAFHVLPGSMLLVTLELVDDFVNLHLISSHFGGYLDLFFYEFLIFM